MRLAIPLATLLVLAALPPLCAQSGLYVSDGEHEYRLVHAVGVHTPWISEDGKLALPAPSDLAYGNVSPRYKLEPVAEYFPALVSVNIIRAGFGAAGLDSVHRLDQRFTLVAKFSSDYDLRHVFVAVVFPINDPERRIYVQEIMPAELRQRTQITIEAPLGSVTDVDKYELHVFSRGLEVFNSEMAQATIEEKLTKMTAKRIEKVRDAAPKPIAGPMPRYPEKLQKTKGVGRAVISCEIAATGQPTNLSVKSATDPAFGEAALAVMSQWWFLPKVENGRAVVSKAELPFDFTPPKS